MLNIDPAKKEAKILKATKELVDYLLSINTNNRAVRKNNLEWIKKSITDKQFILTGQGICVSEEGNLIDGQHRLLALKETGYPPIELLVVTGLAEKSKIYIDQHSKRSTTDMLKIVLDHKITHRMASTITTHIKIAETKDGFMFRKGGGINRPSLEQVVALMEEHSYTLSMLMSAAGPLPRAGVMAAYFDFANKLDLDDALALAESVKNGEKLVKDDPSYRLRAFLLGGTKRTCYGSAGQLEDYKNTVSACIAFANGEKLTNLRPSNSWKGLPSRAKTHVVSADKAFKKYA